LKRKVLSVHNNSLDDNAGLSSFVIFFVIFGCWILPKKCSFCPKINGFASCPSLGAAAPPAPWLVRLWGAGLYQRR